MLNALKQVVLNFLLGLSNLCVRHPWKTILVAVLISSGALFSITNYLGVNTDTSAMLSPDLPYQVNLRQLNESFPQDQDIILLLIEGRTVEQSTLISKHLYRQIAEQSELFEYPFSPGNSEFFQQNGLLFLSLEELHDLTDKLAKAQPFLGKLARNYSLDGLFGALQQAMEFSAKGDDLPLDLSDVLVNVTEALKAASRQQTQPMSWQSLMLGNSSTLNQNEQVIIVKPIQDFNALHPAGKNMQFLRDQQAHMQQQFPGSRVWITGPIALDHEELETALSGAVKSAIMALTLITACLYIGLRSFKMVLVTFAVLVTGLLWTTGFAALSIGNLNIISLAFAVLYIGLGVDYAIHYCLRYQEFPDSAFDIDLIQKTTRSIGASLLLCAMTTSIGFFVFMATDFLGVSELGLIAGVGIFIGLFITLTVLPALLVLLKTVNHHTIPKLPALLVDLPTKHHKPVIAFSLLLLVFSLILITKAHFDPDPINLKSPDTESVIAFKRLQLSDYFSPMTGAVLAKSADQAHSFENQLTQLDVVKDVVSIFDFVPGDQDQKLEMIDDLMLLAGSDIQQLTAEPVLVQNADTITSFKRSVDQLIATNQSTLNSDILTNLQIALLQFLTACNQGQQQQLLNTLHINLLGHLPLTMQLLEKSLAADTVELDTIPEQIFRRWVSKDNIYRLEVLPSASLTTQAELDDFTRGIQSIVPDATGYPVVFIESTDAIVNAYLQAFFLAFTVIFLILLISLRSIKSTFLVIWPLLLGGSITCASTVLLNIPFNYVNVIALPLLLGIGVDNSIHIIHRFRSNAANQNPLLTNTTRAIIYSNLTTVLSFFSLTLTPHAGMSSMGWLLTIGVLSAIFCTLLILPAYLTAQTN